MPMTPEERRKHLTPELRKHFDSVGPALVSFDVSNHNYRAPEKHNAALAWLEEQRRREDRRWWTMVVLTTLGVLFAGIAAWFAYLAIPGK
jgi:hypothetical protein